MFLADVATPILLKISGSQASEFLADFPDQLQIQRIVALIKKFTHFPPILKMCLSCPCQCHLIFSCFHRLPHFLCYSTLCLSLMHFLWMLTSSILFSVFTHFLVIFPFPVQPIDAFPGPQLFKIYFKNIIDQFSLSILDFSFSFLIIIYVRNLFC